MFSRVAFFKDEFVPIEQATINITSQALNYGLGCFEGLRAYWNANAKELFVFRMQDHYERLLRSCSLLHMSLPYSVDKLGAITCELMRREEYRTDVYIRTMVIKKGEGPGVRLQEPGEEIAVYSLPFDKHLKNDTGVRACISSWRRVGDNAIPARGKLFGSYINSGLARAEALLAGYDEAILLTQDGHISEGSVENLFMVRRGQLITSPVSDDIFEGITRDSIIALAEQQLKISVVERPIDRTELYVADEVFLCGTATQVAAVVEIDGRKVGGGRIGTVASALRAEYEAATRGERLAFRSWCSPVYH